MPSILITGGTGKLGSLFVEHFAQKGWIVVFTSTSDERASKLISKLERKDNVYYIVVDLMKEGSNEEILNFLKNNRLKINHLVNNARNVSSLRTRADGTTKRKDFLNEYLLDVVVPYELSITLFSEPCSELFTVTNIGSQYGIVAVNPNLYESNEVQSPIQYSVAKAALSHLTKELAVRFGGKVRVNSIAYGGIEGRVTDEFKRRYARLTPSRRMLKEADIPGPLELLIGSECSSITGHILACDGGWSVW